MADCRAERHEFDSLEQEQEQEQDCLNLADQLGPRVSAGLDQKCSHLEL